MEFRALFGPRVAAVVLSAVAAAAGGSIGYSQTLVRHAEEPTNGLSVPGTPMAGEHDLLSAMVVNPAGLRFLRGSHFGLLLSLDDAHTATTTGGGVGLYSGWGLRGPLGAIGFGLGVEFLRPPGEVLAPDPGEATRLSLGMAMSLGQSSAFGLTWRRYYDDPSQPLHDARTVDLGLSGRIGPRLAWGMVVRDVGRPVIAGVKVQRRWEAELALRPWQTEVFELALGGRYGDLRNDVDGWIRWSTRLVRGVYFKGEFLYQQLHLMPLASTTGPTVDGHDFRGTLGLELSFGSLGFVATAGGASNEFGDTRFLGGTAYVRVSQEPVEPVFGHSDRVERVELTGALGSRGLTNTVLRLRALSRDDDVVAVFLQVDGLQVGWGSAHELRQQVVALRAAGKRVFAYLTAGTTRDYYVASAADRVYVDPAGGLRLAGFAGTTVYFKGLFDKLGVVAQFEKIEEYKSMPETFTMEGPSEPAMRMRTELYDDMYETLVSGIADGRGLAKVRVKQLIDGGPYSAGQLASLPELVDKVVEPDDLGELLAVELGGYYPVQSLPESRPQRWDLPKVAVIYLVGDIVDGKSMGIPFLGRQLAGGETIASSIAAARADSDIEAIVLRIDSPGGSALASEVISREVFKTRGVKPIICSMGNIAASGGYFAAAGCDVIFADETTITGSIGIFTGKFDVSALLARLGLTWSTFRRGEHADRESYFRPYTDQERTAIKQQIRYFYGRFVASVARGRGMTDQQVSEVGRGRVWTGRQAKAHGLVDRFGGVADAVAYAKARAGISDDTPTQLVSLPVRNSSLVGRLLGLPMGGAKATTSADGSALGLLAVPGGAKLLQALPASLWVGASVPQARLPFAIIWE